MAVWPNGSSSIPRVTSEFSLSRRNPVTGVVQPHWGIDLVGWSEIRAPESGTVTYAGYNGGYGNLVQIRGNSGAVYNLAHNRSIAVRSGQGVSQGQYVAIMGTTGNSTGVHCHFETKPGGGTAVNPRNFMAGNTSSGGGGGGLAVDGQLGPATVRALQRALGVTQDGEWGPATTTALQKKLILAGHNIAADGDLGPATIRAIQIFLLGANKADGQMGPQTISAIQSYLNNGGAFGLLMVDGELGAATIKLLQTRLGITADGDWGPATTSALQKFLSVPVDGQLGPQTITALQKAVGATADGEMGPNTIRAIQASLNAGGFKVSTPPPVTPPPASGKLTVDGELGPDTIKALQKSLGVAQDGDWGPTTTSALQKAVGATVDGQLGPQTIKGLQLNVGATADGEMGPATIKALQTFLNAGTAWKVVTIPDTPKPPVTPITTRTPTYPKASVAYNTPNGGVMNDAGEKIANRTPSSASIQYLYVHHTAGTQDDTAFFQQRNSRNSCPTWYVKKDGSVTEFIPPRERPWSTGAIDNFGLAIETQNSTGSPNWGISDESHEAIAQIAAWMSQQKTIDGVAVQFTLDRDHIKGHKEAPGAATACPGPSMNLDWIVGRAKAIVAATQPPVDPDPEPEPEPEEPIVIPAKLVADWATFKATMDEFLNSNK